MKMNMDTLICDSDISLIITSRLSHRTPATFQVKHTPSSRQVYHNAVSTSSPANPAPSPPDSQQPLHPPPNNNLHRPHRSNALQRPRLQLVGSSRPLTPPPPHEPSPSRLHPQMPRVTSTPSTITHALSGHRLRRWHIRRVRRAAATRTKRDRTGSIRRRSRRGAGACTSRSRARGAELRGHGCGGLSSAGRRT